MPRDLSSLQQLYTAEDVICLMAQDVKDRVLRYTSNLTPSEFRDSGFAIRNDDAILVVCSIRASGATTIREFVNACSRQGYATRAHPHELGVVAPIRHSRLGCLVVPSDIEQMMRDAEERTPNRMLSWAGFEGLCVLASHPEAEDVEQAQRSQTLGER